jgi:hypothetical protein
MLVPVFLLGLVLLVKFPVRRTATALSAAVVALFLILGPLALTVSPSLPVDYITNTIHTRTAADPGASAYDYVSNDGYNMWPLITQSFAGQTGHDSIYYPQSATLIDHVTYETGGNFLLAVAVLVLLFSFVRQRRALASSGQYVAIVAAGTMALLVFKTGVSGHHFMMAIVLIILCRRFMSFGYYVILVAVVSVTTLVSMYGSLGFALAPVGYLAPALYGGTNSLTRFFMNLFIDDRFITFATTFNALALVAVLVLSFRRVADRPERQGGLQEVSLAPAQEGAFV